MTWAIPRAFPGGTVVVMASGPSMSSSVAAKVRDSGLPAIVVKDAFLVAPWAWLLYGAEWEFWKKRPAALQFKGLKVSVESNEVGVHLLRNTGIDGFDEDPRNIRTGNNSGYQATHCAIHAGAARVLLTGFDMRGGHFNGRPDGPLRRDWITRFAGLQEIMRGRVDIINCTPDSALQCFPFVSLDEALIDYGNQSLRDSGSAKAVA
jgi:hypothetical protein